MLTARRRSLRGQREAEKADVPASLLNIPSSMIRSARHSEPDTFVLPQSGANPTVAARSRIEPKDDPIGAISHIRFYRSRVPFAPAAVAFLSRPRLNDVRSRAPRSDPRRWSCGGCGGRCTRRGRRGGAWGGPHRRVCPKPTLEERDRPAGALDGVALAPLGLGLQDRVVRPLAKTSCRCSRRVRPSQRGPCRREGVVARCAVERNGPEGPSYLSLHE